VIGRGIRVLFLAALSAATASCETLFSLDGLTGACDAGCDDGSIVPLAEAGSDAIADAGLDASLGTVPDATDAVAPSDVGPDTEVEATVGGGDSSDDGGTCPCVLVPPAPWQGPVALWEGQGAPPTCPAAAPVDLLDAYEGVDAALPECACSCAPPTGAACPSSFSATIYEDHACASACNTITLSAGACTDVQGTCNNAYGIAASPQPTTSGSCAPQPTTVVPAWSWTTTARGCGASGADTAHCGAGRVCAPSVDAWKTCIYATGDLPCPSGAYTSRDVLYASAADGRGCSPCTCGDPKGVTCAATALVGCGEEGQTIPIPTSCTTLEDPGSVQLLGAAAPEGGACAPSGAEPTGSVTPGSPTSVCCEP